MKFVSFAGVALPQYQDQFTPNHDKVITTSRFPGKDGGLRDNGDGSSPMAIGRLMGGFMLQVEDRDDMEAQRDAMLRLVDYGVQKLVVQPSDPDADPRFCWAEINYLGMPQNNEQHTDLWQRFNITWQLADPFFYAGDYGGVYLDDGYTFDDSLEFGAGALEISASGAETDTTVTNNGNATAWVWFELAPDSADSCQNPVVQRLTDGAVVDEIAYSGTLTDTDVWSVDGRQDLCQVNGIDAWDDVSSYKRPELLQLPPGSHTIRVQFANGGDAAQLYLWYFDTYR